MPLRSSGSQVCQYSRLSMPNSKFDLNDAMTSVEQVFICVKFSSVEHKEGLPTERDMQ